ncbi:hypothetical protein B9Z19DRAFT_1129850 [Tuber borchii]|uniref:Uncharacterized protein n=1 Tax=Tuber borchii TaxID=42251 RepID=A0A2T6ZLM7_TUBBO|nr:hypothetical protein B9Z19DRAFT_1129850 [Tuber borchii]
MHKNYPPPNLHNLLHTKTRSAAANPNSTLLILQITPHTEPPPTPLVEEQFCVNNRVTWAQLVAQVCACLGLRGDEVDRVMVYVAGEEEEGAVVLLDEMMIGEVGETIWAIM